MKKKPFHKNLLGLKF